MLKSLFIVDCSISYGLDPSCTKWLTKFSGIDSFYLFELTTHINGPYCMQLPVCDLYKFFGCCFITKVNMYIQHPPPIKLILKYVCFGCHQFYSCQFMSNSLLLNYIVSNKLSSPKLHHKAVFSYLANDVLATKTVP